ncbi:YlbF family regulator [Streptococcus sp. DD12]|uniref:YlbF family regulator n=1 Tax=Streptococcus sp. DD12 TaxID=1777880 RepID=UPI00079B235A|nr:YlbF family regulator [Streptococcus sp. DD12]KXT75650.1 ComK regulator [Streptococcus sp. DD12]
MLIIDDQLLAIEEATNRVISALKQSPEYQAYQATQAAIEADLVLQDKVAQFEETKQAYEEIEAYRDILPEARTLRRDLFQLKRELDLYPLVGQLRQDENALQEVLAKVTQALAMAVDPSIFVDTGLPFAPRRKPHHQAKSPQPVKRKGGKDASPTHP